MSSRNIDSPSVSVVLIGCGAVSQLFYRPAPRALADSGDLCVVALVDPNEKARNALSREFPLAKAVNQLTELAGINAQLAIIASPPKFHRAQVEAALAAGINVLCEKPMASDSREC